MADVPNIGPKYTVNTNANGNRLMLGNASFDQMGGVMLHFVNGADMPSLSVPAFNGSFLLVGRGHNTATAVDNIPFIPIPFRALYLNGVPMDGSMVAAGTVISDTSIIVVPAIAMAIALETVVASGTLYLYKVPLGGTVFP